MERYAHMGQYDEYMAWRKANPKGFVLNYNTFYPSKSRINIIHIAEACPSLDKPPKKNRDNPISSEHPKLCSASAEDLEAKMKSDGLPVKYCERCLKHLKT
jgi:hypothetical protein